MDRMKVAQELVRLAKQLTAGPDLDWQKLKHAVHECVRKDMDIRATAEVETDVDETWGGTEKTWEHPGDPATYWYSVGKVSELEIPKKSYVPLPVFLRTLSKYYVFPEDLTQDEIGEAIWRVSNSTNKVTGVDVLVVWETDREGDGEAEVKLDISLDVSSDEVQFFIEGNRDAERRIREYVFDHLEEEYGPRSR